MSDIHEAGAVLAEFMDTWDGFDPTKSEVSVSRDDTTEHRAVHVRIVPKDRTKPCVEWTLTRTEKLP